jgi:valyl-tRNA synthetase
MLGKNWDKGLEEAIYGQWKESGRYAFIDKEKPVFSIDTPPPYVNAPVHVGQAATYVYMDMFARFRRMKGFNVIFPLGLDRNGLPIEMAAEKRFNVALHSTPREHFLSLCKKILEETSVSSMDSFLKLGISFNSWKIGEAIGDIYFTDSDSYRAMTQATFIDLWDKGMVYEDVRINNYCPGCRTTLADAEIDYAELPSVFSDVKFRVKKTGEEIIISTTRPELIATCAMIIFNPEDDRYKHLEGRTAITPLFGKEVPIKSHPYADKEKGTGIMMMCSFGDQTDIRFFREQNLPQVIAINQDGTMNENASFLKGMKIKEAREALLKMLREKSLLVSQKKILHRTPVCERSKDPIEFIEMKEFYLRQVEFKEKMLEIAEKVNFYSPRSRQMLVDWIDAISIDWPISRRRYYATEIPLWYCSCGKIIPGQRGRYVRPWAEKPGKCPECGSSDIKGDERVFDTWFDSSSSPLYILKWLRHPDLFQKYQPCSLRPQGKEIVRTWLYYTLLKSYLLTGKIILKDTWINYHIVDETGRKMSKRLGNVIDPHEILERYGAEPFRLWCAIEGNLDSSDMKCSFDRIEGASKTLTKLWNVAKFIGGFPAPGEKIELLETDIWILSELDKLAEMADLGYENYDFHNPATAIKHFLWETFSSHYLELVKNRAYNQEMRFTREQQDGALFTLRHSLEVLLKLLAPITPFITEYIYQEVFAGDLHSQTFPHAEKKYKTDIEKEDIIELDSTIWKVKKDNNLSLKSELSKLVLPEKFRALGQDIRAAHNAKAIEYGDSLEIVIK